MCIRDSNKPKAGDIFINNKNIKKIKEKNIAKEVAFLPQGPVCPSGLTAVSYTHLESANLYTI